MGPLKKKQQEKKQQTKAAKEHQAAKEAQQHEQEKAERRAFVATWQPVWDKTNATEQDDIRQAVAGDNPFLLKQERRNPKGTLASLQELARRRST